MKGIYIYLIAIIAAIGTYSQQSVGEWKIYPLVSDEYDKIIDTENKVYFLSASSLYSYDKESNETYFYNSNNKLSGSDISDIYYNHQGGYLLIIYSDSNMDMLYDDGRCYALPDIKDASLTSDKTVVDVAFGNGRIALATKFGLVVYDEDRHEVVESGKYDESIEAITICGDYLLLYSPYQMVFSKLSSRHNSFDKFTFLSGTYTNDIVTVNDNTIAWIDLNTRYLVISTIDFEALERDSEFTTISIDSDLTEWKDGFYFRSGNEILMYDKNAKKIDSFVIPDNISNETLSFWSGKSSVWAGGPEGVANFDLSSSVPVTLYDRYKPESVTCKIISNFFTSNDGKRIYLTNLCSSNLRKYIPSWPDGVDQRQYTNIIEDGNIRDVSIKNASADTNEARNVQNSKNTKYMYGGATRLVEDPLDQEVYYIGNGIEGLYVVRGDEEIWKFNINNTPFYTYWNTRVYDVNFDPQGNLWVGHAHADGNHAPYIMLPADKLRQGFDKIANSDWIWPNLLDFNPLSKDFISLFCKKSNYAFFINGEYRGGVVMLDTKGTYDNVNDDVCYRISTFTDQDGNSYLPQYYYSMIEDMRGRVWIGTNQGLFEISNPSAINENLVINRMKVPRNDGTNYADYLLASEQINSMSVDASNRKWIATDVSGVYLVSENGDKILEHFTTSNSPLTDNRVTAVMCDPLSNIVYFGTTNGLISYKSDSSPAQSDYSNVYAYPNPVRPDYTGWITVTGLMDNSLVKIADTAGNVFFQGRSEGGMIVWDGCNSAGERVRSGIYYVFASQSDEGEGSSGVVTKIMVVR